MAAKYKTSDIIAAIEASKGMITVAARSLGCSPQTIRNHMAKNPRVMEALENQREAMLDTAELALMRAIQQGEGWAVCFALKTLGKQRGYVERSEVVNSGAVVIEIIERNQDESPN